MKKSLIALFSASILSLNVYATCFKAPATPDKAPATIFIAVAH